jgi:hypothetical protein
MLAMNASWDPRARIRSPQGPSHIANPREPIRVTLARDEEVAGLEPETTLNPPPAYGHWRYTVVSRYLHKESGTLLMLAFRESILISCIGNEMMLSEKRRWRIHVTDPGQPTDPHHISRKMV